MTHRIVILGAGTGGTVMANRLRRRFPVAEAEITVVDRDGSHVYQPGLLFVPFGLARPDRIVRPRRAQLAGGIAYHQAAIDRVDLDADTVHLVDGTSLAYDVLVVATGAVILPEETDGLTGPGWKEDMFTFYDLEGASALAGALAAFESGRLVVNVVDQPVKCPVAPLELAFLADWYFRRRGCRDRVEISYVTPLDAAFTKPVAAAALGGLLDAKGIELVTEFNTGEADGPGGRIVSYDEREVPFDLLVAVPVHGGAPYVGRSPGLGDGLDFVPADLGTLQSKAKPNVFAIGDATALPVSKAGSVTHFEAEIAAENVHRFLSGEPLDDSFDGHANCFVETGHGKALLIDFNVGTEPLPGRYPGRFGPFPLLRESRLNHLGKLAFERMYWHALLPGRTIPGITPTMTLAGKSAPRDTDVGEHRRPAESSPPTLGK